MGAAVSITRLDVTAAALRMAAGREKDGSAARRMLAIAMILDGTDRKTAAETCGMDRQTLRDWVHRYNAEGMRGLHDRKTPGPEPKLTADQQAKLAELVETGPDPARHGVVRWRRVDLRDELERRFGVVLHERSVGKVLAKLGYCRLSVRPRHPQTDEVAQEAFKKTSPQRSRHGSPTTPKTSPSKSGSRRGTHRPAKHADPRLGQTRHTAPRAARSALRMGLHLRRRLSATPRHGGPRRPNRQHRGHVVASGRDRPASRAGQPCRPRARWRGLSRRQRPRRPAQHHPRPFAALRTRTQPDRKCLGISARQQTRDHSLRKLR